MLPKLERVWIVRRDRESMLIPIRDEEAANVYKEAGWQVTEIASPALSADEMRCLGPGEPPNQPSTSRAAHRRADV